MRYSQNSTIQRQIMRYSKEFAEQIYSYINQISDTLKYRRGVVIVSKHGIQKAAIVASGFLILKGNMDTNTAINVMKSKEPLFFKHFEFENQNSYNSYNLYNVLYENTLKYIENTYIKHI